MSHFGASVAADVLFWSTRIGADLTMEESLASIIHAYNPDAPLERASTIPASWYTDGRVMELERRTVFARAWQLSGRVEQLRQPGDFVSCELPGGEPVVIARARLVRSDARTTAGRMRSTGRSSARLTLLTRAASIEPRMAS
jgi:hypothetical protein